MQISINIIVFCSILSFALGIAGTTWLFLRQEAMRTDVTMTRETIAMVRTEVLAASEAVLSQNNKLADAISRLCSIESRASSHEESIRTINNKMSSRERAEKRAAREEPETPEPERRVAPEIDPQQEVIDFPGFAGAAPPGTFQPLAATPPPPKRKFGTLP